MQACISDNIHLICVRFRCTIPWAWRVCVIIVWKGLTVVCGVLEVCTCAGGRKDKTGKVCSTVCVCILQCTCTGGRKNETVLSGQHILWSRV